MWFKRKSPTPPQEPEPVAPPRGEVAAAASSAQILDSLRGCIVQVTQGRIARDAIDPGAHLFDNGYLDSLTSVALLTHVEREFGVRIPEVQLVGRLCTLEAIAREICSQSAAARR